MQKDVEKNPRCIPNLNGRFTEGDGEAGEGTAGGRLLPRSPRQGVAAMWDGQGPGAVRGLKG